MPSLRPPPPRWISWLFPQLAPLDENPLYHRLRPDSARKRGWSQRLKWSMGPEFAKLTRAAPGWWTASLAAFFLSLPLCAAAFLAALPLFQLPSWRGVSKPHAIVLMALFVSCELAAVSLATLGGTALSLGRKVSALKRFVTHASCEAWGEDLSLSPLLDSDYDRGVAAALVHWHARNWWRLFLAAVVIELAARYLWFGGMFPGEGSFGVETDLKFILIAGSVAALIFSLKALYLAFALRGELAHAERGGMAEVRWAMARILALVFVHFPGAFMASGLAYGQFGGFKKLPESLPLDQLLPIVAAYVAPTLILSNLATRIVLRPDLGAIGRAMRQRIRLRYDGKS